MTSSQTKHKLINQASRFVLLLLGFLSTALGVVGIFLPALPTVPFFLLALTCFSRSSERFYDGLVEHAYFGPIIHPYINRQGMKRASKVKAIALLWTSILLSAFYFIDLGWIRLLLLLISCGVTIYLIKLPVIENNN